MTSLELGNSIIIGDITLIIITHLSIHADRSGPAGWLHARKEPYALLIRKIGA